MRNKILAVKKISMIRGHSIQKSLTFYTPIHCTCSGNFLICTDFSFHTGLELTFFSGVFGTCVGNVKHFGDDAESYIGICGILIGTGEVVGK